MIKGSVCSADKGVSRTSIRNLAATPERQSPRAQFLMLYAQSDFCRILQQRGAPSSGVFGSSTANSFLKRATNLRANIFHYDMGYHFKH